MTEHYNFNLEINKKFEVYSSLNDTTTIYTITKIDKNDIYLVSDRYLETKVDVL